MAAPPCAAGSRHNCSRPARPSIDGGGSAVSTSEWESRLLRYSCRSPAHLFLSSAEISGDQQLEPADHTGPEAEHAENKDAAEDRRAPGAPGGLGQQVLQRDNDAGADEGPEQRADSTEQGHQHYFTGYVPVRIGQRSQLKH